MLYHSTTAVVTMVVAVNMTVAGTQGIVVKKRGKVSKRNLPRAKRIFAIGVA